MLTKKNERKEDGKLIIKDSPSPWRLEVENSWIIPFNYKKNQQTFLNLTNSEYNRQDTNGLGMVMAISYSNSNCGPYDELLFGIPCKNPNFQNEEILPTYRIPVIYVSTEESVRNGRKNWGIRKELANFKWKHTNGFLHQITSLVVTDRLTGSFSFFCSILI